MVSFTATRPGVAGTLFTFWAAITCKPPIPSCDCNCDVFHSIPPQPLGFPKPTNSAAAPSVPRPSTPKHGMSGSAAQSGRPAGGSGSLGNRPLSDTARDEQPGFAHRYHKRQDRGTKDGSDMQQMTARVRGDSPWWQKALKQPRRKREPLFAGQSYQCVRKDPGVGRGRTSRSTTQMPDWKCLRPRLLDLWLHPADQSASETVPAD